MKGTTFSQALQWMKDGYPVKRDSQEVSHSLKNGEFTNSRKLKSRFYNDELLANDWNQVK